MHGFKASSNSTATIQDKMCSIIMPDSIISYHIKMKYDIYALLYNMLYSIKHVKSKLLHSMLINVSEPM